MNPLQHRPTRASSIWMLIFISVLAAQTVLMLLGLSLSLIQQTFSLILDLLVAVYLTLKDYYLAIITFLLLIISQKLKLRLGKCIGDVLQVIMDPHIKCYLCHHSGGCDWNCKNCRQAYHHWCFWERGIEFRCPNAACGEIIFNEKPHDVLQFIRTHQRYALHISLVFVFIGLIPTFKAASCFIDQLAQL